MNLKTYFKNLQGTKCKESQRHFQVSCVSVALPSLKLLTHEAALRFSRSCRRAAVSCYFCRDRHYHHHLVRAITRKILLACELLETMSCCCPCLGPERCLPSRSCGARGQHPFRLASLLLTPAGPPACPASVPPGGPRAPAGNRVGGGSTRVASLLQTCSHIPCWTWLSGSQPFSESHSALDPTHRCFHSKGVSSPAEHHPHRLPHGLHTPIPLSPHAAPPPTVSTPVLGRPRHGRASSQQGPPGGLFLPPKTSTQRELSPVPHFGVSETVGNGKVGLEEVLCSWRLSL